MRNFIRHLVGKLTLILFILIFSSCKKNIQENPIKPNPPLPDSEIKVWVTSGNKVFLFRQAPGLSFGDSPAGTTVIEVDSTLQFQTMDGFGYALTGGSAYLINQKLSADQRTSLLTELFQTDTTHIGISYLRVSIGASDLDDHPFSYDDLPSGQTDATLTKFSLDADKENLIPVLKQILALIPDIKIMGSPWSAPAWMKTNGNTEGGSLKEEYYPVYAQYFVKYLQGMAAEGITIDAITLQNEPENPNNNPSMVMTASEQATFVKNHLGPAFATAGLTTKIVVFDHNCDHPQFPIAILNDPDAKKYIDGSAFHLYAGNIEVLSDVHNAHIDKNVYFTEQWTSAQGDFANDLLWATKNLIVGAPRNWSRNVLEWNLAADPSSNPHTDGGCTACLGAVTIGSAVSRNVSYYIIAQASKFVRPGSVRIASNVTPSLSNVAFLAPDGKKVLIVVNEDSQVKGFTIKFKGRTAAASLPARSVGTFVW